MANFVHDEDANGAENGHITKPDSLQPTPEQEPLSNSGGKQPVGFVSPALSQDPKSPLVTGVGPDGVGSNGPNEDPLAVAKIASTGSTEDTKAAVEAIAAPSHPDTGTSAISSHIPQAVIDAAEGTRPEGVSIDSQGPTEVNGNTPAAALADEKTTTKETNVEKAHEEANKDNYKKDINSDVY